MNGSTAVLTGGATSGTVKRRPVSSPPPSAGGQDPGFRRRLHTVTSRLLTAWT
ncbi:hypothetical protein AB0941_41810 [Streptomyces sp. NPDC013433]|jgi:hypothetical protein|uniref:hypothetical protein n=1 Tax=Streptomyces sp. NPDC013433 TaxID=3155604 RepID=UPI0034551052